MKITDSKGLVVRVGGTIHVDGSGGGPTTPPLPPILPVEDAWYPIQPWDPNKGYSIGAVVKNGDQYWMAYDWNPPKATPPDENDSGNWDLLSGASLGFASQTAAVLATSMLSPVDPLHPFTMIRAWSDRDMPADSHVMYGHKIWHSTEATTKADVPGTSPKWEPVPTINELASRTAGIASDVTSLTNRIDDNTARLNDLTDASPVEVWDPAVAYPKGTVMRHGGSTWLAKSVTVAGDEPNPTSTAWALVTLEGLYALIVGLTARVVALETPPPPPPPPVIPDASWSKDDIVVWLEERGLTFTKKVLDGLSVDELLLIVAGVMTTP